MSAPDLNPYAPSTTEELASDKAPEFYSPRASQVIWRTILAIALAGGLFGLGFYLIYVMGAFLTTTGRGDVNAGNIGGVLFLGVVGFILGFILAGLPAIVIVPVSYAIYSSQRDSSTPIAGKHVLVFGAVCGFLCGTVPVSLASGFNGGAILFSLLPGAVGAAFTPFAMLRFSRRVDQQIERQREAMLAEATVAEKSPFGVSET